jgi:hypothetical protein
MPWPSHRRERRDGQRQPLDPVHRHRITWINAFVAARLPQFALHAHLA